MFLFNIFLKMADCRLLTGIGSVVVWARVRRRYRSDYIAQSSYPIVPSSLPSTPLLSSPSTLKVSAQTTKSLLRLSICSSKKTSSSTKKTGFASSRSRHDGLRTASIQHLDTNRSVRSFVRTPSSKRQKSEPNSTRTIFSPTSLNSWLRIPTSPACRCPSNTCQMGWSRTWR